MATRRPWLAVLASLILLLTTSLLYSRLQYSTPLKVAKPSSDTALANKINNHFELNPQDHTSRTPTILTYTWRVTAGELRPDGVLKRTYLINDVFPGPTIEARSGDTIIVHVENALFNESVSIHWHGLSMRGHNDMDGAAGVTQEAIRSGQVFTYEFKIADDQAGTFWYHAHSAVQRADGLYGGLIVHSPLVEASQNKEYLLMIGDWYHRSAEELLGWYLNADSFGMEPVPDSIIINGQGIYKCENAVPARPLDCQNVSQNLSGLRFYGHSPVKLRIVNVGAYAGFSLAIPGASMRVNALDGGNMVSSQASPSISGVRPGERIDVVVSSWSDNPQLELTLLSERWKYSNPALEEFQRFTIELDGREAATKDDSGMITPYIELSELVGPDEQLWEGRQVDETILLYTMTEKLAHLDYIPSGNINRTIWKPPTFPLLDTLRGDWDGDQFIVHIPFDAHEPRLIDLVINNLDEDDHPFHLHGHDFYIMQTYTSTTGWGSWNAFEQQAPGGAFATNPLKKDTVMIPRRGYAVLRFLADNPGIWMFHCHVMWHLAGGMAMALDVS